MDLQVDLEPLIVTQHREAEKWLADVHTWHDGRPCAYNPSARKFDEDDLVRMAQQEGLDRAGISGFPLVLTADALLKRAYVVALLAALFGG